MPLETSDLSALQEKGNVIKSRTVQEQAVSNASA